MPTAKQYHQCAQVIGHCKGLGKGVKGYHKCASDSNCKKKDREKVEALSKKINMPEQLGKNIFKKFVNKKLPMIREDIKEQKKLSDNYLKSPNAKDFEKIRERRVKKELAKSYSKTIAENIADDNDGLLLPKKFIDGAPVRKGVAKLQFAKDFALISGDYESGNIDIKEYNMEVARLLYSGASLNSALKKYGLRRDGDEIVGLKYK